MTGLLYLIYFLSTHYTQWMPNHSPYLPGDKLTIIVRERHAKTQLVAEIESVLPDGSFFIKGNHRIVRDGAMERFILKAIVRPEDIRKDHTVMSSRLSKASLRSN